MVYRFTWIAGVAAIAMALLRLNELMRPTVEGAPWQLVVIAGVVLGAVVTWTALAYRLNLLLVGALNAAAFVIIAVRISVPDTTVALLPTSDSIRDLGVELDYAMSVVRAGVAPVIPATGLVVLITGIFWALGALMVWGLLKGKPYVALLPAAVVYLQLATADRGFAGLGWTFALLALIAGSLAAVTFDERVASAGRLTRTRRPVAGVISSMSLVTVAVAFLLAIGSTAAFAGAVPTTGVLEWRTSSGLTGEYFGGISYNPFVRIRRGLVNQNNAPVFTAQLSGDIDPKQVYWRMLTLDTFNGVWWYAKSPQMSPLEDSDFEEADSRFTGPTSEVVQDIIIQQLSMDWLPASYSPTSLTADDLQVERGMGVAEDASIRFGSLSFRGMNYRIRSQVPQPDLGVLALGEDGEPTQAFVQAIEDGDFTAAAAAPEVRPVPSDRYLDLPEELDPVIHELAGDIVFGLESDYEKGLAIEAFLRSRDNGFRYSTEVPVGETNDDLAAWLFDADNPEIFRVGYCEQFATAMGVLARAAGVPSRVVLGFTPGQSLPDGTIVVLDNNAHAWVELWLGTQGWVRFDPTPRADGVNPSALDLLPFDITERLIIEPVQVPLSDLGALPPIELDPDEERFLGLTGSETPSEQLQLPAWAGNVLLLVIVVAAVIGLLPLLKWIRRRRRLRRFADGDITAAWDEIVTRLSDLGDAPHSGLTPLEVAERTDRVMVPLASVYTQSVFAENRVVDGTQVAVADDAFHATEATFGMRYSPARRVWSWYKLRSLLPGWARRRRRHR